MCINVHKISHIPCSNRRLIVNYVYHLWHWTYPWSVYKSKEVQCWGLVYVELLLPHSPFTFIVMYWVKKLYDCACYSWQSKPITIYSRTPTGSAQRRRVGRREWAAQFSDTQQAGTVGQTAGCMLSGAVYKVREGHENQGRKKGGKNEHAQMRHRSGTDISLRRLTGKLQSVIRLRVSAYSSHLREKLSLWTPKRHMGEWNGSIRPIILNLGIRWKAVVRFTLRVALPPE